MRRADVLGMGKGRPESEIVSAILLACNRLPGVRLFRLNSRVVRMPGQGGRDRLVRFGWLGASDIIGWRAECSLCLGSGDGHICRDGRSAAILIALEVKRPGGAPTSEQQSFLDLVRKDGGIAGCVHSVQEAMEVLG